MLRMLTGFAIGAVVTTATLIGVWAASSGDAEVRVAARRLDDGRVEVAVQQRSPEGWSERERPEARFLPADAPPGEWRVSGAVAIALSEGGHEPSTATTPGQQPEPENPAAQRGRLATTEDPYVFCLVTHEHEGDETFWNWVRQGVKRYSETAPVEYRLVGAPTASRQAALVRECIADGVDGIAVTLADPDGLAEAIAEARSAGILVASFNSGIRDFKRVGSHQHVASDETRGGQRAAEMFRERGVAGLLLCVIHEARNVGLEERCEGLAGAHAGEVERLRVDATGVQDLAGTTAAIHARLTRADAAPVAGILALNTRVGLAARDAIRDAGADVALGTFDHSPAVLEAIVAGQVLFTIYTDPWGQGYLTMTQLMRLVHGGSVLRDNYQLDDPYVIIPSVAYRLSPEVITRDGAEVWLEVTRLIDQINQSRSP